MMLTPLASDSPEDHRHPNRPSRQTSLPVWCLRVVVWLSPNAVIIASLTFRIYFLIGLAVALGVAAIAGCFDAILSRSGPVTEGAPELKSMLRHSVRYVCVQIIFAPILLACVAVVMLLIDGFI